MRKKFILAVLVALLVSAVFWGWCEYAAFMAPPTSRLQAGAHYPAMPPDEHHFYIELPLDYADPTLGTFTDFYLLSPNFQPGSNAVFLLFDNQQEAVGLATKPADFAYYDTLIGADVPYVLIGNRGVSPTLFPEAFNNDGTINYPRAVQLYGSQAQIQDIEAVRQDMLKKGLLPPDGTIMVMGGSGGGVLVQQYLEQYGQHVSRALLMSTGAPDLAAQHNLSFSKNLYEIDRALAERYFALRQQGNTDPALAWLLFRVGLAGQIDTQAAILDSVSHPWLPTGKLAYLQHWLMPINNFSMVRVMLASSQTLEVRVRIWELTGDALSTYNPRSIEEVNLLYESMAPLLSGFRDAYQKGEITAAPLTINRSRYQGEVLVWANVGDQDFGMSRAQFIVAAYPHARLAVFPEQAHHVALSDTQAAFARSFFETGLDSDATQAFLSQVSVSAE